MKYTIDVEDRENIDCRTGKEAEIHWEMLEANGFNPIEIHQNH